MGKREEGRVEAFLLPKGVIALPLQFLQSKGRTRTFPPFFSNKS